MLDLSSGSSNNTVDFFLMSKAGIVVLTPETTSVLNAYSFLKTAVRRLLSRSFPAKSAERDLIDEFMTGRIERNARPLHVLVEMLETIDERSASRAREQLREFTPRVVINEGKNEFDLRIAAKLREVVLRNLGIQVGYIGFVPYEPKVPYSVVKRRPVYELLPGSSFDNAVDEIARRLIAAPAGKDPALFDDDQDLNELAEGLRSQVTGSSS
jgi:flagellar biosynthesis protein FlhG